MPTNRQRREAAKRKLERQQERRVQQAKRRRQVAVITAAAVVVLVVVGVVLFVTLDTGKSTGAAGAGPSAAATVSPSAVVNTPAQIPAVAAPALHRPTPLPPTTTCAYPSTGKAAKPVRPPPTADVSTRGTVPLTLRTTAGEIGLVLDRALAPCTVHSMLSLAGQGYFDGSPCHRLTTAPGLQVLQCGDPTGSGSGGPGYAFADEIFPSLTYGRGYLAMANAGPNTNGSQFFMIYGDASALSPRYTVFGTVTEAGLKVVDQVAKAGDDGSFDPQPGGGKPVRDVTIQQAVVGS